MKKLMIFIFIIFVISVTLYATNPNKYEFKEYAEEYIKNEVSNSGMTSNDFINSLIGLLSEKATGIAVDNLVERHDYYIFSVYEIKGVDIDLKFIGVFRKFIPLKDSNYVKPANNEVIESQINQPENNMSEEESQNIIDESEFEYSKYVNERYGFSIDYPLNFIQDAPPENGDGLRFYSKDNMASIVAYGSNNVFNNTVEADYKQSIDGITGSISYKKLKNNWYVISWINNGIIFYNKTFVGSGSINAFEFSYPKEQDNIYAPVIEHVNKSFEPGNLDEAH